MNSITRVDSISLLRQRLRGSNFRGDVIPDRILEWLAKGDKVPVYKKHGTCVGVVFWADGKLRYSSKADLR